MCHTAVDNTHYVALCRIVSYLLAQFAETSTNSLGVLQELVSALVNTSLLQIVGPTQLVKQESKETQSQQCMGTNLLGGDALGCEIIDAVVEATLDQVAIQSKKILHLNQGKQHINLKIVIMAEKAQLHTCLCSII